MPSPAKSPTSSSKNAPVKTTAKVNVPAKPSAPLKAETPAAKTPSKSNAPAVVAAKKTLTPAERTKMITEAAYYLAEKRGFAHGHELADWATAEKQVDALLAKRS